MDSPAVESRALFRRYVLAMSDDQKPETFEESFVDALIRKGGPFADAVRKATAKYPESPRPAANCYYCGKRIKPTKTNKQRSYCDDKCKQAAYRRRMRRRGDHTLFDEAIADQHRTWHNEGFSDELIQALMALLTEYGGPALIDVHKILALFEPLVIQRFTATYMRDNADLAARLQAMEKELEEMRRNVT